LSVGHAEPVRAMTMEEQTELLQNIWSQMQTMDRTLNAKLDVHIAETDKRFAQVDQRLDDLSARMRRGFDRIEMKLVIMERRLDDLELAPR
jgi:hypothetical protein